MRASTTPFNQVTPKSVIEPTERRRDEDLPRADEVSRLNNTYTDNAMPDRYTWTIRMAIAWRGLGDSELAVSTEQLHHPGVVFDSLREETKP